MFPLFDYFKENTISKNCPDNYKRILKALSKNSPVCGYIHPSDELHHILEDVVSGENITCNADKMKVLHEQGPSLYKMISQSTEVSDEEKALITDILFKVNSPFNGKIAHDLPHAADANELSFFPSIKEIENDCEKTNFLKRKRGHPTLLPGLFTMLCPHGKFFVVNIILVVIHYFKYKECEFQVVQIYMLFIFFFLRQC